MFENKFQLAKQGIMEITVHCSQIINKRGCTKKIKKFLNQRRPLIVCIIEEQAGRFSNTFVDISKLDENYQHKTSAMEAIKES